MADHTSYDVHNEEEDQSIEIDEDDVIETISLDDEDLPDAEDEDVEGEQHDENIGSSSSVDNSIQTFSGHSDSLFTVAGSPTDPSIVASGGGDNKVFFWKVGQEAPLFELQGHTDSVVSLSFSHDGRFLASGGLDGVVHVWDTGNGSLVHKLEGPVEGIEWVQWHPRGHIVLAGSEDATIWMWNAGAVFKVYTGHSKSVTCGCFTPDGKAICTGSDDGTLRIITPKNDECKVVLRHDYSKSLSDEEEGITCISVSMDSKLVVFGTTLGSLPVISLSTGKVLASLSGHTGSVECLGFSPSMTWIATGGMDGKLIIWELQGFTTRSTCLHEAGVWRLSWSSSSQHLVTACLDGTVRLWDSRQGVCERIFHGHHDSIQDMSLTVDGQFVITGSDDKTAKIFQIRTT